MEKEIIEFFNEVMDSPEVPRRLRLWALQLKTTPEKRKLCADELTPNSCKLYNLRRGCHNCERFVS